MNDEFSTPGSGGRVGSWTILAGAVAGAAAIYFFSSERGRQWLRELPEIGRNCAATTRQAMAMLRDITEQVERAVGTFEQALGHVGETLASRETATAGSRNGGEHALAE
jgi:hypothetical protein